MNRRVAGQMRADGQCSSRISINITGALQLGMNGLTRRVFASLDEWMPMDAHDFG